MSSERMSFEEASRELGISEEELEQLVAAGEIASVKEGDTLFFKKAVVQKFKKSREATTPTILLSDDEISLLDEGEEISLVEDKAAPAKGKQAAASPGSGRMEISLDDDLNLDDIEITPVQKGDAASETQELQAAGAKGGKKKPSVSDDETLLNLDGLLEEDSEGTTPVPQTVAAADPDSTLLDTDLLDVEGLGGGADPFASDTVEETTGEDLTEVGTLLRGGGARVMQMKRKKSHAAWTAVLAASALLLILPLGIVINMLFVHSPQTAEAGIPPASAYTWITDFNVLGGLVEALADMFRST